MNQAIRLFAAAFAATACSADRSVALRDTAGTECGPETASVQQVIAKASNTLRLGRTVDLVATAHGPVLSGSNPPVEIDVPIGWTSSNPDVLRVAEGRASGLSEGVATLIASACDLADTVDVQVTASGYGLVPVELPTAAASQPTFGVEINDSGWVAARTEYGSPLVSFVWREDDGVTALGDCAPLDMNVKREVLCAGTGPRIWANGAITQLDVLPYPVALNDSSHVAANIGNATYVWRGPGDTVHVTPDIHTIRALTNDDRVAGTNVTGFSIGRPTVSGSPAIQVSGYGVLHAIDPAAEAAVGYSSQITMFGRGSIALLWKPASDGVWRPSALRRARVLPNDIAASADDINSSGVVVGNGTQGPFVWSNGRLSLLRWLVADAEWIIDSATGINTRGQILARARRGSGLPQPVVLTPP